MWGKMVGVQVSKKDIHTYIHLDWDRVEILSCIKKNDKMIINFTTQTLQNDVVRIWMTPLKNMIKKYLNYFL